MMCATPLVSVCVPTYNYGRFLANCLQSVVDQSVGDWELVISDDASTDDTQEVATSFAARDRRIRYVRNDRNLGMNANIKRAAELGTGRFLKILCSDDWLTPDCLEIMSELMARFPNVGLASAAEIYTDADGRPLQVMGLMGKPLLLMAGGAMLDRMALGSGFGGNSSLFIRRSCYQAVGGYDGTVRFAADYELGSRLCRIADYLHTDQPLFYARGHPSSSSSLDPRKLLDVLDWFDVPRKAFSPRPFGSRDWQRYQVSSARVTSRYMVNLAVQYARGNSEYARALREILIERGNFLLGVPLLLWHAPKRVVNAATHRNVPPSRPLESRIAPQPRAEAV